MPVSEPVAYKVLTTADLRAARELLLSRRFTGLAAVQYADGSRNEFKGDAQIAAALAALDAELARRAGTTPVTTLLVSSSKGLDT